MKVLIIGTGIAGLTAALHLNRHADVTVLTKAGADISNTARAQGGIAAVTTPQDAVAEHVRDTLAAGATWCDAAAVEVLCSQGPERIADMIAAGVRFDRDDGGALALGLEAAHSRARVLHAGGDATGAAIARGLLAAAADAGVQIREHTMVTDLLVSGGRARGARVLEESGAQDELDADAVILATGGAGQLFGTTSNPAVATGDGVALAARAGAGLADLEFYQFHPTTLAVGGNFLISEAVRGEGAVLRDHAGVRFMPGIDPRAELAPRDVVARAVAQRMRATGKPVYLDATALGKEFLARRFPSIDAAGRAAGLDWASEPIPVTPAAHYWMGGVATDLWGRTTLPGLFAVGETACTGVHGGNRLASNSLLEGAVFGHRAAELLLAQDDRHGAGSADLSGGVGPQREDLVYAADLPAAASTVAATTAAPLPAAASLTRPEFQQLMWECAGLTRTETGLARAEGVLAHATESSASGTTAGIEDENLLLLARLLTRAARKRTTSLGAHYRSDHSPDTGPVRARAGAVVAPDLGVLTEMMETN